MLGCTEDILTEEIDGIEIQGYTSNNPVVGAEVLADHLGVEAAIVLQEDQMKSMQTCIC